MKKFNELRGTMQEYADELGVFVRAAQLSYANQLINLNKCFRFDMAQWEAGVTDAEGCASYPVLDFDDVQYILEQEDAENLTVIGRRLENEESIVGYSYSYLEDWVRTTKDCPTKDIPTILSPRPNRGKGKSRNKKSTSEAQSLYIAELFIADCERGLGLGELLLSQTLLLHPERLCKNEISIDAAPSIGSHLFVSSKNVGAVKCYNKFGYEKGVRPSGDAVHDLVMELVSCEGSVVSAVGRLEKQLDEGTVGARKRRPLAHKSSTKELIPRQIIADIKSMANRSPLSDSRASSRATLAGSPKAGSPNPHIVCPRATRRVPALAVEPEAEPRRTRSTRSSVLGAHTPAPPAAAKRNKPSPTYPHMQEDSLDSPRIQGRQRKNRRVTESIVLERKSSAGGRNGGKKGVVADDDSGLIHNMDRRSVHKSRFLLSTLSDSKKKKAEEKIKSLGGEVIHSDNYDHSCTHVISGRPATTEKYMCALAAGKHLLHPSYLEDSEAAGYFLPEEKYEWGNMVVDDAKREDCSLVTKLAKAQQMWRNLGSIRQALRKSAFQPMQKSTGCFEGMRVALISSNQRVKGYRRMLEAGGAVVCADIAEMHSTLNKEDDFMQPCKVEGSVSHVFISKDLLDEESGEWNHEVVQCLLTLHSQGACFLREEYIVDKLMEGPDLRSRDYSVDRMIFSFSPFKNKKRMAVERVLPAKRVRNTGLRLLMPSH